MPVVGTIAVSSVSAVTLGSIEEHLLKASTKPNFLLRLIGTLGTRTVEEVGTRISPYEKQLTVFRPTIGRKRALEYLPSQSAPNRVRKYQIVALGTGFEVWAPQ
jgi:hypothetical protein